MTALRGYTQVGHHESALKLIDEANDRVCRRVRETIEDGGVADGPALIGQLWSASDTELLVAKEHVDTFRDQGAGSTQSQQGSVSAGTVVRFRRAFGDLHPNERQVVILRLAGFSAIEVAAALDFESVGRGRLVFNRALRRLRKGQLGEQFNIDLWREVESCFNDLPEDLRSLFDRLQDVEPDAR